MQGEGDGVSSCHNDIRHRHLLQTFKMMAGTLTQTDVHRFCCISNYSVRYDAQPQQTYTPPRVLTFKVFEVKFP